MGFWGFGVLEYIDNIKFLNKMEEIIAQKEAEWRVIQL
jgi:hypothetical protein